MVGQIVVLAIVCVGITAVTELALNHHLVKQLDGQLAGTSFRSALMYPEPNHPGWHHHQHSYYPRPGPARGSWTPRVSRRAWWRRWSATARRLTPAT
ncbi:putative sensor histidine kinase TcrY domain protein [Mycobacterium intracellulare 1956]|uniref:Putative sensor histidine kinase TcrY domain protein n=1 Tax=Mycobacterium intracellulare 1956 TaxID=1299331 RepID=X8CDA9_MYCIT|nr:putative sensor histidine kinase TcrY domain protein [Mycobacterium intracellulare 1956]